MRLMNSGPSSEKEIKWILFLGVRGARHPPTCWFRRCCHKLPAKTNSVQSVGPRLETWQHLKHHVPLTETKTARRRKTENLTEVIFWIGVCVLVTSDDKWVDSSLTPWPCRLEEVRGNTFWCQEEAEEASSIFFWVCKMSPRLPRDGVTSSDSSHGRGSSQKLLIYSQTTKKRTKSSRLKSQCLICLLIQM